MYKKVLFNSCLVIAASSASVTPFLADEKDELTELETKIDNTNEEINKLHHQIDDKEDVIDKVDRSISTYSSGKEHILDEAKNYVNEMDEDDDLFKTRLDCVNSIYELFSLDTSIKELSEKSSEINLNMKKLESKKYIETNFSNSLENNKNNLEDEKQEHVQEYTQITNNIQEEETKKQEAKLEEEQEQESALKPISSNPVGSDKEALMSAAGISSSDFQYVDMIISRESGWNASAQNPAGGYGLCQAVPGSKMSSAGSDWQTNPVTQLKWCSSYAEGRYGSWAGAASFWQRNHWW